MQKKEAGFTTWLLLSSTGVPEELEAERQSILRRTSLPARDLRLLKSDQASIVGRERAIVVNLEHIKAIILPHEVLLANYKDKRNVFFIEVLQRRLPPHFNALGQQVPGDGGGGMNYLGSTNNLVEVNCNPKVLPEANCNHKGPKVLPFEFRVLEACLEAVCGRLEIEAVALQKDAHTTLEALMLKINTLVLEDVRSIKGRLVRISWRVQKVRDEIEKLLDDDKDMAQMYLSNKSHDLSTGPPSSSSDLNDLDLDQEEQYPEDEETGSLLLDTKAFQVWEKRGSKKRDSSSSSNITIKNVDVSELEMLLEAYFVQIDGTLNKLSTLREFVDDTENYINIMLGEKQNQLLETGVMICSASLATNACFVVSGIFGMNFVELKLFTQSSPGYPSFWWVVLGSSAAAALLHLLVMVWCRRRLK